MTGIEDANRQVDIGDVVERSGVTVSALHLWERRGLLTPTGRRGLRRQYPADTLDRVATIVLCQQSGFTLAEIAELLDPHAFVDGKGLLVDKLTELRHRRDQLNIAIEGLEHAMACTESSPLICDGFRQHLDDVLPVSSDPESSMQNRGPKRPAG